MTKTIATPPKLQFFATDGTPLANGKLYAYAAGTTTPLDTFTDSTGGSTNTNPIILDSRGEASVWLGTSQYKFKLTTSAGVELWTVDNVNGSDLVTLAALAASSGSSLVNFLQSGTGAVSRTVQARLRDTVNVTDFSGVDNTGVADSTAGIAAAFASLGAYGGTVYFPPGTYKFSSLMFPNKYSIKMVGAGRYATRLNYTGSETGMSFFPQAGYELTGFWLYDAGTGVVGIDVTNLGMSEIHDVVIEGFDVGILADIGTQGTYWVHAHHNLILGAVHGISITGVGTPGNQVNQFWMEFNRIYNPTTTGIKCASGSIALNCRIVGNDIESTGALPRHIDWQGDKSVIENNWLEGNDAGSIGLYLRGTRNRAAMNTYAGTFATPVWDLDVNANEVYEPDQGTTYSNLAYQTMADRVGIGFVNTNPTYPLHIQTIQSGYSGYVTPGGDFNTAFMLSAGNSGTGRQAAYVLGQNGTDKWRMQNTSTNKFQVYDTVAGAAVIEAETGNKLGFFGTAAAAKPTGVAVSAAGIHAALVTLGLIAGP